MTPTPETTTAVILAGGLGTRLRPIVDDRPKIMADVAGRPFIHFVLDHLHGAGISKVVLCTGFMAEAVSDILGDSYKGMELSYSREHQPLGTGGAIADAISLIDTPFVLGLNGDTYCGLDYGAYFDWHENTGANASIVTVRIEDTTASGRVEIDANGRVTRFEEKAPGEGPGWINAGVFLTTREMIAAMDAKRPLSIETEVFPDWVSLGLSAYPFDGGIIDIGTPESYQLAKDMFSE